MAMYEKCEIGDGSVRWVAYGSNSSVILLRVRLLRIEEKFSELLRMGEVCPARGGLCDKK